MGEDLKDVNFDVGSRSILEILKEVSMIDDISKKSSKLEFHLQSLKEELKRIDVFKRELPHCMYLLKDAIERLKEEMMQWNGREMSPVMEEFLPLKSDSEKNGGAKESNDINEMKKWMSSVQLWSTPIQYENDFDSKNQDSVLHLGTLRYEEGEGSGSRNPFDKCNLKNRGGAFLPFKKPSFLTTEEEKKVQPIDGLSLSNPVAKVESIALSVKPQLQQLHQEQQQRKNRRCWSPDLHKRFIDALYQLGGAQSATPKQIRELMKVDGLTNDEVKSHLQKYRLHIRKLPPANISWLKQGPFGDFSRPMVSNSGSPQGPLVNGGSAKGASTTGGDSMEEEEDEKTESHSWKGRFQKPVEKLM
ncbi:hypothetical protein ACJIZ3_014859 [Penstemon smallii]|uniref:HTH myb-type domain-containing protein n=1 Tax=Penstemon smallii TaxID=265156 RepID=A0ABD3RNZ6_9LAMI